MICAFSDTQYGAIVLAAATDVIDDTAGSPKLHEHGPPRGCVRVQRLSGDPDHLGGRGEAIHASGRRAGHDQSPVQVDAQVGVWHVVDDLAEQPFAAPQRLISRFPGCRLSWVIGCHR
jgi:hypothetical protein